MNESEFSPGLAIISVIVVLVLALWPSLLLWIFAIVGIVVMAMGAVLVVIAPVVLLYWILRELTK